MFSVNHVFGENTSKENTPNYELAEKTNFDQSSVERAFARTFSTDDGKIVLSHLQSITFQRALGAEAPDEQLRYMEGQRSMMANIMRLIRCGRDGATSGHN